VGDESADEGLVRLGLSAVARLVVAGGLVEVVDGVCGGVRAGVSLLPAGKIRRRLASEWKSGLTGKASRGGGSSQGVNDGVLALGQD
jgi:hypothetical protein